MAVEGFWRMSALSRALGVVGEGLLGERALADAGVDDASLLDAILDLATLRFSHRVTHVERHRADLRVRHQAPRTEDSTELADGAHHVGRRDHAIEVHESLGDLCHHVVASGEIGAGLSGLALLLALGEDEHANGLTRPVRENERSANHLIGVLGIHAQTDREIDRFVEFGELRFLDDSDTPHRPCTCASGRAAASPFARFLLSFGIRLLSDLRYGSPTCRRGGSRGLGDWEGRTIRPFPD